MVNLCAVLEFFYLEKNDVSQIWWFHSPPVPIGLFRNDDGMLDPMRCFNVLFVEQPNLAVFVIVEQIADPITFSMLT